MADLSVNLKGKLRCLASRSPTSRGAPQGRFPNRGGSPVASGAGIPFPKGDKKGNEEKPDATPESPVPGGEEKPKKRRREQEEKEAPAVGVIPSVTLDHLGGLQRELPIIRELIDLPIRFPHLFSCLGAEPPRGVLLHGPPGCGKTKLAHAIAGTLQVPLFYISAPEIVQGISGDSEAKVRTLFNDAISVAPSIIFIDEIDTIAGRRESAQREMEKRIVAQLLTCMDQLSQAWREYNKVVCVLGATNRPEAIDTALRRAGRFDREIPLGIPTVDERREILQVLTNDLSLAEGTDFFELAQMTPGYVGADLQLLVKEACVVAIRRKHRELERAGELENVHSALLTDFRLSFQELKDATKRVQPSAMREGFTTIPNVTWSDVGALEKARAELVASVLQPIRAPKLHKRFGLDHPIGVLLYGPPGCGKTLVAKAIANESGANFISIKGPELLNKFVGESERSVRMVFARGRASAPCVLFFDELDALAPRRGSDRANPSSERVVNQLLTEMDGVDDRSHVYVIAATNRPDMIDPAMLRPGRLDKLLYIPLPSPEQRVSILRAVARKFPLHPEADLDTIGRSHALDGFSGADLASVVREASLLALKEIYDSIGDTELREVEEALEPPEDGEAPVTRIGGELPTILQRHLDLAASKVRPSVSAADRKSYEDMDRNLEGGPAS